MSKLHECQSKARSGRKKEIPNELLGRSFKVLKPGSLAEDYKYVEKWIHSKRDIGDI